MRRRRRRYLERRGRNPLTRLTREWEKFELAPETRRNVAALLWFLFGIISSLSLFGVAGRLGVWLKPQLFTALGWGAYIVPFVIVLVSLTRLDPERFPFSRGRYAGLLLALVMGLGLLHLPAGEAEGFVFVDQGRGGGYLGFAVSYWLRAAVGGPAATFALVVLFSLSLVLLSNRTPGQFFSWLRVRRLAAAHARLAEQAAGGEDRGAAEGEGGDQAEESVEGEEGALEGAAAEAERPEPSTPILPVFSTRVLDGVRGRGRGEQEGGSRARVRLPPYERPPVTLLSDASTRPVSMDVKATQVIIQRTLETFDIKVEMGDVSVGPTVTQYTLRPAEGVKLSKIVALHNDLALALAAHPIRIEAPIPGKGLVGIEVPNKAVSIVRLREILSSEAFTTARGGLVFALGKDVAGTPLVADLERMPHVLLAGATGSGKSVLINCLLVSLLSQHGPVALKLILVDPKRVELSLYNGIPHLLAPVVTQSEKVVNALRWAVAEMDRRYELLSGTHRRDLASYNHGRRPGDLLPRIVIVIDELADIMARHQREMEDTVVRLAQIARAVGIHLVLATQRPSVDVITGLIKANITSRIAFKVASAVDARTVLDTAGAEKLLGSGDMLFLASDHTKPRRIQGAYVSEEEVKRVVAFLVRAGEAAYDESVTETGEEAGEIPWGGEDDTVDDELFAHAKRVVIEARRASTSLLQRRLRIGYARAARIMDILEGQGIIGPPDGARPREVLVDDRGGSPREPKAPTPFGGDAKDVDDAEVPPDQPEEPRGPWPAAGADRGV